MGIIIDEKFKDSSPVKTVEKIRQILEDNQISVTETWQQSGVSNCYALRLEVDGTSFGTNGKGVTPELARASAHAELMERLQTGSLGYYARFDSPDAVLMDRQTLKENSDVLFSRLSQLVANFDGIQFSADDFLETAFQFDGDPEKILATPFYNLTDDNTVYLPSTLMRTLYSSTGLAAGNSPEEAMVQGMSEIVERWCQRHFLCKGLVPPTIPEDYLKQFPRAYETITQVRNSGYDVIVKDCSMGLGWPAIATAVINKKTHAYHVHMGASPVFEIALGRSLTETFQGRGLKSVADTYLTESPKNACTYRKSYVKGRGAYPIGYFTDEPSFPFVPFEDRSHCTNRELLQFALQYFKNLNMKVYARDMSYWGFHTYHVIIPEICISHFGMFTSELNVPRLVADCKEFRHNIKSATEEQLFEQQILNFYRIQNALIDHIPKCSILLQLPVSDDFLVDQAVGYAFVGYVEWGCGNKNAARTYYSSIERLKAPGISDYFSCLNRATDMLKEDEDLDTVMRRLSAFYEAPTIAEVTAVLKENTNPFAPYMMDCSTDAANCAACRYVGSCRRENDKKIGEMVTRYAQQYDHQAARENLRTLLRSLS